VKNIQNRRRRPGSLDTIFNRFVGGAVQQSFFPQDFPHKVSDHLFLHIGNYLIGKAGQRLKPGYCCSLFEQIMHSYELIVIRYLNLLNASFYISMINKT